MRCPNENLTNSRHKRLNVKQNNPNPNEDIEKDENKQSAESNPEIRAFMQKYWTSIRTVTKRGKVQNIFNFFYDGDFKDLIETLTL